MGLDQAYVSSRFIPQMNLTVEPTNRADKSEGDCMEKYKSSGILLKSQDELLQVHFEATGQNYL